MAAIARTSFEALATLSEDGKPPETRIADGRQAREIFDRMVRADISRAFKRSKVRGLIDGNPPFNQAKRRAAGMADKCNINFRVSESYVNNASGAFYDLATEAPNIAHFTCRYGTPEEREIHSRKIAKHWNWLVRGEACWDYHLQMSQAESQSLPEGEQLPDRRFLAGAIRGERMRPQQRGMLRVCATESTAETGDGCASDWALCEERIQDTHFRGSERNHGKVLQTLQLLQRGIRTHAHSLREVRLHSIETLSSQ